MGTLLSTQRTEADAEIQLGTFFEDAKAYVVGFCTILLHKSYG